MKFQNTFTFIVSKNYGHPLSWSMPAWRVYLVIGLGALLLAAMAASSTVLLSTYPRLLRVERERAALRRQRDALREQILFANQEALSLKEGRRGNAARAGAGQGTRRDGVPPGDTQREAYLPPLQITKATSKVNRRTVEVVFRIAKLGEESTRGGFLFAIFENQDRNPPFFSPSPNVKLNEQGFPQTYKSGIRFSRVNRGVTYRRAVKRQGSGEYFTHVTLFLFSLRGGLLVKDRYSLDREMFRKETQVVKQLELAQT